MEKKPQNAYEILKKNKSLEPIAELVRLAMVAKNTAEEAEDIGDKLSVFACKAETTIDDLPPAAAWMNLCDKYKDNAREFARILKEAVKASGIDELEKDMKEYTEEVIEKTAWLVAHDRSFRAQFEEALRIRKDRDGIEPLNKEDLEPNDDK